MIFFTTYLKVAIKNYWGRCSIKGCEKVMAAEGLAGSIQVGKNKYALCVEHQKLAIKGELDLNELELENYLRWPTQQELRQAMLETTKIIAEALQE